jgi:hypothetical protein
MFVAAGMCLPSRCLAMNIYSDFTIPAFGRHVTICFYFSSTYGCRKCAWNRIWLLCNDDRAVYAINNDAPSFPSSFGTLTPAYKFCKHCITLSRNCFTVHATCTVYRIYLLAYFSYLERIKGSLWDHLSVSVRPSVRPSVYRLHSFGLWSLRDLSLVCVFVPLYPSNFFVFYAVLAVTKESRRSVLPRTFI